jgi:hypothetical protein
LEIELAANLVGLAISVFIGRFAYSGYSAVGSPNLLRLTIAFISISAGFVMLASALFVGPEVSVAMETGGLAAQAVGYFFIAMSHGLKSSFDFLPSKHGAALLLVPFTTAPFIIPGNSIEHLVRSISFILLVYVSIETIASYMQSRKSSTLMIGSGLSTLAAAEIVAWYGFIFPGTFALPALAAKVAGFGLMVVPFSRLGFGRMEKVDGV